MGQEWTEAPSIPSALVSMLLRLPKLRFVIVTLGENGCIMLERSSNGEFWWSTFYYTIGIIWCCSPWKGGYCFGAKLCEFNLYLKFTGIFSVSGRNTWSVGRVWSWQLTWSDQGQKGWEYKCSNLCFIGNFFLLFWRMLNPSIVLDKIIGLLLPVLCTSKML